jgi:diacylglycerol kinase (ATP)
MRQLHDFSGPRERPFVQGGDGRCAAEPRRRRVAGRAVAFRRDGHRAARAAPLSSAPMQPESRVNSPAPTPSPSSADSRSLKGRRGLQRVLNATRYSIDGLRAAWSHEDAFRQEVMLAAVMIPVAVLLPLTLLDKILLVAVVVLVLIVELLNTGIEAAIDRDGLQIDPLGKRAKDYGSAAVMLALLLAGGTWAAILLARFVFR